MVRNDDFFLRKWVEYYGRELGKENLYIYYDGEDQAVADICQGTNVSLHPKIGNHVIAAEKGRLRFLSERAAELFARGYEVVIGVDADEYIVVDPKLGIGLREYFSRHKIDVCLSPLGLDFGQKLGEEDDLSFGQTFLSQRHYAQIGTRYTKASIIAKPCQWGSGFHRVKGKNYYIAAWHKDGKNTSTSGAAPYAMPQRKKHATSTAGHALPASARRGADRPTHSTSPPCSS